MNVATYVHSYSTSLGPLLHLLFRSSAANLATIYQRRYFDFLLRSFALACPQLASSNIVLPRLLLSLPILPLTTQPEEQLRMLLFFFLVLESLIFDVHAIFYANTTSENTAVSTFDPSAATSARPASVPITTVTPSSTSNAANITTSAFAQSSNLSTNSSILNVNTTSLPYLTIFVDANAFGTSTITECPGIYSIYHEYMQDPRNSTCCNYYNASGNVAAFDSWMTAGDDATSPYVGAKFGCCGDCVVRANNIQVYFWPGAQAMMECTTEITVSGIDTTVTPPTSYFISYFSSSWVDPAFGCNGSAPTPITTVINDNTLTSPTPWIGFTSIAAYDHCSQWWGMFPIRLSFGHF